jgi:hypothetical protein
VHAHGLAHAHALADRDRSGFGIGAEDRANQEVAATMAVFPSE